MARAKATKKKTAEKESAAGEKENEKIKKKARVVKKEKAKVVRKETVEKKEAPAAPQTAPEERPKKPAVLAGEPHPEKRERYFEAVGRRKTSVARVRLFTRPGDFLVNGKLYANYFPTTELQKIAEDSLQKMKLFGRFKITVKVSGGGVHSQAEALRHGLARCFVKFNPDFRKRLKRAGFLKRDPRMKERKKPGLKRARRAPQWAKR